MKEILLSNCERKFINTAITEESRLDGRSLLEARPVEIYFGSNWGSCIVSLGRTRTIAQVSCDIQQPKAARSNEGMIHINVELNPIAAQHFESGRQSELAVLINRQLEKCYKDSKCIDLESLCLVAEKKVWNLRLDINILNHDGNLVDCASIAALAALLHFRRPDVTCTGTDIVIHPFCERDPLPLTLFYLPICISFITFESGNTIMDPTYIEERVGVAQLTLGINSYTEVCSLHFDYLTKTIIIEDVISAVSNHAAKYATKLVQQIKDAVANDVEAKYQKDISYKRHFKASMEVNKKTQMKVENTNIKLRCWNTQRDVQKDMDIDDNVTDESTRIIKIEEGFAELITKQDESVGKGGHNSWYVSESSDEEMNDISIVVKPKEQVDSVERIELSGDSEEEEEHKLYAKDLM